MGLLCGNGSSPHVHAATGETGKIVVDAVRMCGNARSSFSVVKHCTLLCSSIVGVITTKEVFAGEWRWIEVAVPEGLGGCLASVNCRPIELKRC